MNKIILDFEGKEIELEASLSLVTFIATDNAKFSFNNNKYVVRERVVVGIEKSAENLIKKRELLKDTTYKGDLPDEELDLLVKLEKE